MKSKIALTIGLSFVMMILIAAVVPALGQAAVQTSPATVAESEGSAGSEHGASTDGDINLAFMAFAFIAMIVALGAFTFYWGQRKK